MSNKNRSNRPISEKLKYAESDFFPLDAWFETLNSSQKCMTALNKNRVNFI